MQNLELNLKQSQKLSLTYLMLRAFKILQMTNLELEEYISNEIEKNPILEITDTRSSVSNNEEDFDPFFSIKYAPSLFEHLMNQAKMQCTSKTDLFIAENIIGNLDDKGYFTFDVENMAKQLRISKELIFNILKEIQNFEPKGLACKNLKQRILLQLDPKKIEYNLIEKHFDLILLNKFKEIEKKEKIKAAKLQKLIEKALLKIDFNPTSKFKKIPPIDIIPDVVIKKIGKNWIIEIEENIANFEINKSYVRILEKEEKSSSKRFVLSAKLLMKNILKRRKTLLDIATYIAKKQKYFLLKKDDLYPITIKEVAHFLNLHPSTISRALNGKFLECPRGVFPMRSFFSPEKREEKNQKKALSLLKELIKNEDKKKPYKDEELASKLRENGFDIKRRTVSKYRKKIFLGSSYQRKKY